MDTEDKKLIDALDRYFSREKKFIDTSRIPLICQDIHNIHESQKEIKEILDKKLVTNEAFWPIKTLVYGMVGLLGVGIIAAILKIIIK